MICVIPAKATSRRVPGKNIRAFFGKPMMAYSIETAKRAGVFERILVSTDDDAVANVAWKYGAEPWTRRAELTEDRFGPLDVAANLISQFEYREDLHPEFVCVLTATSPLVTAGDLHDGLRILRERPEAHYAFGMGTEPPKDSGSWYWCRAWPLSRGTPLVGPATVMVAMPPERTCDINEESDWQRCEEMYAALYPTARATCG